MRLLHVAPEAPVVRLLKRHAPTLNHVSTDFHGGNADLRASLTSLPFRDESIDCAIVIHVLEHVDDDRAAMREVRRVLKPGAWAVLQVPLDRHREQTDEDPTVTSALERQRRFGQGDHVRLYGYDYRERLASAGFTVHVEPLGRDLPPEQQRRFGLHPEEDLYVCFKT
jgi:SAM-dependent methyltransferase